MEGYLLKMQYGDSHTRIRPGYERPFRPCTAQDAENLRETTKALVADTAICTGLAPDENGKADNGWMPGEANVHQETLFDDARLHGFQTGYFYSKTGDDGPAAEHIVFVHRKFLSQPDGRRVDKPS